MNFYTAIYVRKISRDIGVHKQRIQTLDLSVEFLLRTVLSSHFVSDLLAQMVDANLFVPIVMRDTVPHLCDS